MAITVSTNKNWSEYEATSSTSLAITNGALTALTLTIETGKAYVAGDDIALVPTAAKIPFMLIGTVTSYNSGTGALVANCTRIESQIPSWDLVSASTNTVGTGAKTFITYNSKSALLAATDNIMVGRRGANGGNRMVGTVTSYNNADGTLVMNCATTIGSGTSQTDWIIVSSGTFSAWKIVPSPITNITLTTIANLTFDMEPSYPIGSLVSLDRGRFISDNPSTSTPWVIELGSRNTNSGKLFQLENNGRIDVTGESIIVKTGDGTASQTLDLSGATYAKIDYPAIEVETGSGTGVYRPWYVMESSATGRGFLGKNFISRGYKNYFTPATSATVTLTTASPTVITWASHGLRPGNRIRFTTTGTFTGITSGTDYYVLLEGFTTGSFRIGISALTNVGINVTAQSGTHTASSLAEFGTGLHGNVALWNPTTRILTFGDGTQGNVIPNGAKVRIPNTHFTMEYPRTPIMSAISSATAGNAVSFMVGAVGNIPTFSAMPFIINQEEFTGNIVTSTMTTATRNVNGTVAANHAQGDTVYILSSAVSVTGFARAQTDNTDGGIVNLSRCSFGNVFMNLSNGQNAVLNNVWVTGGCTIGSTTADVTINGLCSQPHPITEATTLSVTSVLGATSAQKIYSANTALVNGANQTTVTLSNLQNAVLIDEVEGLITTRNNFGPNNVTVNITAVIANTVIKNISNIGGRFLLQNLSRFEVDGIVQSSESSGVISQNVVLVGLTPVNCQYGVFRNMSKAAGGAAVRGNVIQTDANCANLVFHSIDYDAANNANAAISPLGNNITLANSNFGTFPDRGAVTGGTGAIANTATGDTVTIRNVIFTSGDTYGSDNGTGATARCFLEQTTGHSMWWRAAGSPFNGNYQETGPFHVLLDDGVKNAGTLCAQFSVKASRDIYDLNGGAYLNNGGSVFLPTTGDFIVLKSYQVLRTITGFTGTVDPEDVNTGNLSYSFEMVGHEGTFAGSYTSLTTANLNSALAAISGYDDAKGFKFNLKITATSDSATNQVIQVRMFTTNNAATVLPIGYTDYTLTGLLAGSTVGAYDGATEVSYTASASGALLVKLPYDFDGLTDTAAIKIRALAYVWDDHTATFNQYAFARASLQISDSQVTVTNSATIAAYTGLETTAKIYDYCKYWGSLRANLSVAQVFTKIGTAISTTLNVVVDKTAAQVFSVTGNTVTIKADAITTGTITTTGTLTTANGALMQITYTAGGITYSYATATVSGFPVGARLQIYNVTTSTEVYNGVPGSAPYVINYSDGSPFTTGDSVRVRKAYISGVTANLCEEYLTTAVTTGWDVEVTTAADTVYNALAIDGSAVTGFSADYVNDEVNVTVASNWSMSDLYAWWVYNMTTAQGLAEFYGGLTALDVGNFRINSSAVNLYLDNATATNLRQLDNRRIYRDDDAYPVKSSGGGGMDVVWRNTILVAETGVSGLTAGESSTLAKIDTLTENVSGLRFTAKALETAPSGGGGGSAPTVAQIRAEMDANSTKLAAIDAKTTNLPAAPAAVGSEMTLTSAYNAAKTAASQASVDGLSISGAPVTYTATSATRVIGDNDGGTVTNLAALDGSHFITGESSSLGLEVTVDLSASSLLENPSVCRVVGSYRGAASHSVAIYAWNYVTSLWDSKSIMADRTTDFSYVFPVGIDNANPSTGAMRLRFKHTGTSFSNSHSLNLDYIAWEKVASNSSLGSDIAQILANQHEAMVQNVVHSGTAQGGTANTITLSSDASSLNGSYDPSIITIYSGNGAGQSRIILQYIGATRVAVVNRDWRELPNGNSMYVIHPHADIQTVNEGLVTSATSNTVRLNIDASTVNGTYIGQIIAILSGTGSDQTATITAYNGSTQTATIAGNWVVTPDSTSAYVMLPISPVMLANATHTGAVIPRVTLVDTTTTNTDMRGTDGAITSLAGIATATNVGDAQIAIISALPSEPLDSTQTQAAAAAALIAYAPAQVSDLALLATASAVAAIPTTPLLAANYTAPDNAGISQINSRLPSDPADQSLLTTSIGLIPSGVRAELATELARIDTNVSEAATPAEVTTALTTYDGATQSDLNTAKSDIIAALPAAPDNVGIAAAKLAAESVNTRLPAAPANEVTVVKTLKAAKAAPFI